MKKALGYIAAITFCIWFIGNLFGSHDTSSSASTPPQPQAQAPLDLNSSQSLDDRYGTKAAVSCSVYADDYLRQVSKYTFKWDDIGFLEQKFDKFLVRIDQPGVLIMASNKVSLQNGFGAYQRAQLYCHYDTQADKVAKYEVLGVN
jgi:hypothetical protein